MKRRIRREMMQAALTSSRNSADDARGKIILVEQPQPPAAAAGHPRGHSEDLYQEQVMSLLCLHVNHDHDGAGISSSGGWCYSCILQVPTAAAGGMRNSRRCCNGSANKRGSSSIT